MKMLVLFCYLSFEGEGVNILAGVLKLQAGKSIKRGKYTGWDVELTGW